MSRDHECPGFPRCYLCFNRWLGISDTKPPAAPASQEHTMDKHYATNATNAASLGYAGANMTATEADAPTPVAQALINLRDEISEVHYHADSLIHQIAPALRMEKPTDAQPSAPRPAMASELAEQIQQLADSLRMARAKLIDARERVTL